MRPTLHASRLRRIAFVNFTGMRDNWGCQATSWECVKWLRAALPPDCEPEVVLVPLMPRCELDARFEAERDALDAAMHAVCARAGHWRQSLAYLEAVCLARYGDHALRTREADLVLFQAEGTMAGSDFLRGIRLLLLPFVARHAWQVPVLSVNQTLFSCDERFSRLLAAVYNSFDWVAVRENASHAFGRRLDIEALGLIPDFAFLTRPQDHPDLPPLGADCFAIAGSAFHSAGRYRQLLDMAARVAARHGLRVLVIASRIEPELLEAARERLPAGCWLQLPFHLPYPAVAAALKRCRFLLSGRYHMNILAMAVSTPVIQLRGNSWKNEGLDGLVGGLAPVRDFGDGLAVQAAVDALFDDPQGRVVAALQQAVAAVHARLAQSHEWLHRLLTGRTDRLPASLQTRVGQAVSDADCLEPYRSRMLDQAAGFAYPVARSASDAFGAPPQAAQFEVLAGQADALAQASLGLFARSHGLTAAAGASSGLPPDLLHFGIPGWFSLSLEALKDTRVEAEAPVPSFGRHADLADQARMLQREFSGQSGLLLYHALLTVLIRRRLSLPWALERWSRLWESEADFLCAHLDSRWLVSACDTALDHGANPACRALAGAASLFVNTIKLYETERAATPALAASTEDAPSFPTGLHPLHDGLTAFVVGHGDMVRNLFDRLEALCDDLAGDPPCRPLASTVRTLLARACRHDTVLRRFGLRHRDPATDWLPRVLHFCGDSHLRPPHHAWQQGWFGTLACRFTLVGGATAVGLRHPTSRTQALQAWEQALLPCQRDVVPVFQLGEVDCGFVIWLRARRHQDDIDVQLQESLDAYGRFLCRMRDAGYRDLIVTSAMLPTLRDGELDGQASHQRREVAASLAERTALTHRYNACLAALCQRAGLRYLDFTPDLRDARTGLLHDRWRHPAGSHHLDVRRGGRLWVERLMALLRETGAP